MWSFIVDNGPLFTMFGVVGLVVLVGVVLAPLLKRRGIINRDDVKLTNQLLEVVGLVVAQLQFKSDKNKEDAATVIQIARTATTFVFDMMGDAPDIAKRDYAFTASLTALQRMGIEVTDGRKRLIEITIAATFPANAE